MGEMPKGWAKGLSRIEGAITALLNLPTVCAEAYATTKWRARPIIDRHFMADNVARYGWPDLAPSTLLARMGKGAESNKHSRKRGRVATAFAVSLGPRTTPVLVATGILRNAVMTTAEIEKTGPESVRIMWTVPNYAHWHVDGGSKAGRPPVRNFLKPNQEDLDDVREVGQNFINQAIGEGRISFGLAI